MGLLMTGAVFPFLAFAFAGCISLSMDLMVAGVIFFVQIPFAYFSVKNITAWHVISYYVFILALFCLPWHGMFDKLKQLYDMRGLRRAVDKA